MLPCVNGRYLVQRLTGVQRYAREIVSRWEPVPILKPNLGGKGASGHLWEQLRLPTMAKGLLWSPCTTGPIAVRKQVVTIHDTAFVDRAECFTRGFAAWYQWLVPRLARRVQRIITVSHFSKQRIVEHCRVPEEKVEVVSCGVGPQFRPQPAEQVARAREELKLPSRYALCVCSLEPRKNLLRLLQSWSAMQNRPDDLHLVIVGARDNIYDNIGLTEPPKNVHLAGYVGDDLLPAVYAGAEFFACPSLYEGFGLPVIEAMACGVPVICSNTTSLPEVAGDAAILVDPLQIESIAAAMQQLATDAALRAKMREQGLIRAQTFSWDDAARKTWNILAAAS
ncbi:GDP-mannose-dependent alpha-(1-6)-phosphatidylinositol monomannoside mannosyltransferase [Anatilimnocola aggregata]|uniref:GDP-mannose-dependent alpha-(1-6)-phosphatidylinositol monomannoside mannosyltransferase n=1 Tax=Anatilimnocola aggregata TaxID=2528021 RepID=A0A517YCW0_9BACT|nr:glycosyltransferase family 1 protein [Anatilimnocola aggregata]QDU27962.1 GDP-mannose-dependent alpha-(1-6)-phosphatidylinositol monomannoside mannosyltransferase [Anatilimnocola aggregata]